MNHRRAGRRAFRLPWNVALGPHPSIWERYNLGSDRHSRRSGEQSRLASPARPNRFRLALEEAGGLFARFGQFLSGRSDLLPAGYLGPLRNIRAARQEALAPSFLPELRGKLEAVEWLRSFPCSEVYAATRNDQPVVIEIFPLEEPQNEAGFPKRSWLELERQIALLKASPEAAVAQPLVLEQFREWMDFQADVARKRAILRGVQEVPLPCVTRFPRLAPELQSTRCLATTRLQGRPLADALGSAEEDGRVAQNAIDLWTESWLEQPLLLSMVDSTALPENYLLLPGGGLGLESVPALIPVPVEWHHELLQYLASAVAGNAHRALQMLARICSSDNPYASERQLLERLSALQPELRIHETAPESVVALENYWRALGQTSLRPPLFLQLFHRNLAVLGQSATGEAAARDVVSESLWPVLARILQFRVGELLAAEKGTELLASSALLMLSGMRQMTVTLEQLRDNDLALEIETQPAEEQDRARNRRVSAIIHSGFGLVLFLISLQVAQRTTGAIQITATVAAALCAAAVCILVARIE